MLELYIGMMMFIYVEYVGILKIMEKVEWNYLKSKILIMNGLKLSE